MVDTTVGNLKAILNKFDDKDIIMISGDYYGDAHLDIIVDETNEVVEIYDSPTDTFNRIDPLLVIQEKGKSH